MTSEADRRPLEDARRRHRRATLLVAIGLACLALGVIVGRVSVTWSTPASAAPVEGSTDAGFARDMTEHHAQAVQMATTLSERTNDPDLQYLAKDIALTQQAQIGRMSGWLEEWGLPTARPGPAMAWMQGHRAGASMPGLASQDDVNRLASLPVADAEVLFLQLMIRHHRGGVEMARSAITTADRPNVRALAEGIIKAQESEIAAMTDMLRERGAEVPT